MLFLPKRQIKTNGIMKREEINICKNCAKHKTMACPNSIYCFATKEKPYFIPKFKTSPNQKDIIKNIILILLILYVSIKIILKLQL